MAGLNFSSVGFVGALGGPALATNLSARLSLTNSSHMTTVGQAFALGLNWSIEMRVRSTNTDGVYVFNHYSSAGNRDYFGIIYGFVANTYELYWPTNSTGATQRLALPAVSDALQHIVRFTYDGTTIRGFLDGVAGATIAVANVAQTLETNAVLTLGERANNIFFAGDVDYLRITAGATNLVNLSFNEASGPAINAGTLGDFPFFGSGAGQRVALP